MLDIARDQRILRGLREWDGALVAVGEDAYRIDLAAPAAARAVRSSLPGVMHVRDVAMAGDVPVALVETASGLALALRRGVSWSLEPLPEVARSQTDITMSATIENVALWHDGWLHLFEGGRWRSKPVPPAPLHEPLRATAPRLAIRLGSLLFLGWDCGEWGGALLALDLHTGTWRQNPEFELPVRGAGLDRQGRLWVASGLAHMLTLDGELRRLDPTGWTVMSRIEGASIRIPGTAKVTEPSMRQQWDLPLASFDGMAFDERGRLHVLSGAIGVARREADGCWTWLTPGWPREHVYVQGLALRGSLLVIATLDAGVVVWDANRGTARRVLLER